MEDSPTPETPAAAVEASVAAELEWILNGAVRRDWRADHPTLPAVYQQHPELEAEVAGLWGPELAISCGGFLELVVLAHHAGLLFTTDGDELVAALPEAAATLSPDARRYPFISETDEDRAAVRGRLAQLRQSKVRRAHYVDVVGRAWAAARHDWERHGRPGVEMGMDSRRRALARGAAWQELVDVGCFNDRLAAHVAEMGAGGRVVVTPAYYTHKGLYVDLPGMMFVSVRTDVSGAEARARTERLAKQLKTLSDPTRLAILDALRREPRTVGQLAEAFALAQPTVSNHVKTLRDAGLVSDAREGRRRNLMVRPEVVADLVGSLQGVLGAEGRPQG